MTLPKHPPVLPDRVARIGMVARWRPVHLGHTPVLRALCRRADRALIGIGSANRYDLRNPFTLDETLAMLRLALADVDNYELVPIPDLDDGPRWRAMIAEQFGPLDIFVTENPYVARLMVDTYTVMRPVWLIHDDEKVPIDGAMVRRAMAQGDGWQELVPPAIADYIVAQQLDARFRREFGLQTLALDTYVKPRRGSEVAGEAESSDRVE
ncbi:MAG: hypothetical protein KDJ65_34330 [Anaerolineae bacterium]|nr:hypothetical protein [Anaerolineae bacterium]